jgi:hypothetical protein
MAGAISYIRTVGDETKLKAEELKRLLQQLLIGNGSLQDILSLVNQIGWDNLSSEMRAKLYTLLRRYLNLQHEQLNQQRSAIDNLENNFAVLDDQQRKILTDFYALQSDVRCLEASFQTAIVLSTNLPAGTPYDVILNASGHYQFEHLSDDGGTHYFRDEKTGALLCHRYLEKSVPYTYEAEKIRQFYADVDNLSTMKPETRKLIEEGFSQDNAFFIKGEYSELQDMDLCLKVLDDVGIQVGTYDELKNKKYQDMTTAGHQKEHYPPLSSFYDREKESAEGRHQVPTIDGIPKYSEGDALCWFIHDGQSVGTEHRIATDGAKEFARKLITEGRQASLGEWLDKGVEYNTEAIAQRLMLQEDIMDLSPERRKQLKTQVYDTAKRAAFALRNVTAAHIIAQAAPKNAEEVLKTKLNNHIIPASEKANLIKGGASSEINYSD